MMLKNQIVLILFSILSQPINLLAQTDVIKFADIMHLISICPQKDLKQCLDSKLNVLNYRYEQTITDSEDESLVMTRYRHKFRKDFIVYNQLKNVISNKCCSIGFMTWDISIYQSFVRELDGQGFVNVGTYKKNDNVIHREYRSSAHKIELLLIENKKYEFFSGICYTFLFSFY
jgi:hypothetical protein